MNQKSRNVYFRCIVVCIVAAFFYSIFSSSYYSSYFYGKLKVSLRQILQINNAKDDDFCFLKNPIYQETERINLINCYTCEPIKKIQKVFDISYEYLELLYISQNIPVIVIDAMYEWNNILKDLHFQNITQIYDSLQDNIPCFMLTNINLQTKYISDYLSIILNPSFKNWFITWKNCDISAVKAARNFYQQPYFEKYVLPAASINWMLLSSDYKSKNYKTIFIEGKKLLSLMQLKGCLDIQLIPAQKCTICTSINNTICEQEILLFNSEMWQIQYLPREQENSMTIMTENDI